MSNKTHDHDHHQHHDHHHHGHHHHPAPSNYNRAFLIGLILNVVIVVLQVIFGLLNAMCN
ncbi:MAG: hypothetical protein ACKO2V_07280 [Snowella sp.]